MFVLNVNWKWLLSPLCWDFSSVTTCTWYNHEFWLDILLDWFWICSCLRRNSYAYSFFINILLMLLTSKFVRMDGCLFLLPRKPLNGFNRILLHSLLPKVSQRIASILILGFVLSFSICSRQQQRSRLSDIIISNRTVSCGNSKITIISNRFRPMTFLNSTEYLFIIKHLYNN